MTIEPGRSTRCCTRPSTRSRVRRARPRRGGVAGRGEGRDRVHRRRRGRGGADGRDVILVRPFTEADDVAGFFAAKGILTSEGGKASHAALVARGMGVPAVTGASDAGDRPRRPARCAWTARSSCTTATHGDRRHRRHGDHRRRPLFEPEVGRGVRHGAAPGPTSCAPAACAPTPTRPRTRARRAIRRRGDRPVPTEHMFFGEDRHEKMVEVILADEAEERRGRLAELLPLQQGDFEGIFEAMEGLPVTIRLLDPPLHEFLPDLPVERARRRAAPSEEPSCARVAAGGQPDARHPRGAPRDPVSGDYEMQVGRSCAPKAVREPPGEPPRGHDPARRLRARARAMRDLIEGVAHESLERRTTTRSGR